MEILGGDTFRAPKECRAAAHRASLLRQFSTWLAILDRSRLDAALAGGATVCAVRFRPSLLAGTWTANGQSGVGWHRKDVQDRRVEHGRVGCCAASRVPGAPRYAFREHRPPAVPLLFAQAHVADVDGEVEAAMHEPGLLLGRVGNLLRPARQLDGVADAAGSMAVQASGAGSFGAAGVSPSEDGQGYGISADAFCFDRLSGGGKRNTAMATWRQMASARLGQSLSDNLRACWGAVS